MTIRKNKGLLLGLLATAVIGVLLSTQSGLVTQPNESLVNTMRMFQGARIILVLMCVLFLWNPISGWIEKRFLLSDNRIRDKRTRVLIWYIVIESVFAMGIYL